MDQGVIGADGRQWSLRSELEWRTPATADDFEHDVAGGHAPVAVMIVIIALFVAVLLIWMPEEVVVPAWVLLALFLTGLFFPTRWVLRRPWKVVAETDGTVDGEQPAERWVGTVRGMYNVRAELAKIRHEIRQDSVPAFDGPLRPVD